MDLRWLGFVAEWLFWDSKLRKAQEWGAAVGLAYEHREEVQRFMERCCG
jgi:hypothetical protein